MFNKVAQYLLPHLVEIAQVKVAEDQNKDKNKSEKLDSALKTTQLIQNVAGTAALGLGAFAIGKAMADSSKEKKLREQIMARQLEEYLNEAQPSKSQEQSQVEEKERIVDEILRKAAEAEIFAKPKEVFEYREYLLKLPYEQAMHKIAELEKEIARKHLKLGEAMGAGFETNETNVDPLTQWILEKALYKG